MDRFNGSKSFLVGLVVGWFLGKVANVLPYAFTVTVVILSFLLGWSAKGYL